MTHATHPSVESIGYPLPREKSSSGNTLKFAVAIILTIGFWIVAGIGLGIYFQGSFSHLVQLDPTAFLIAGCGGGMIFLLAGLISLATHCKRAPIQEEKLEVSVDPFQDTASIPLVYGPEDWAHWGVNIFGAIPPMPEINWEDEDPFIPGKTLGETSILIFKPSQIIYKGKIIPLNAHTLKEIIDKHRKSAEGFSKPFLKYYWCVEDEIGKQTLEPGWFLFTRHALPGSGEMDYEEQKRWVESKGYFAPLFLEAAIAILLVYSITGKVLYQGEICCTRCEDRTVRAPENEEPKINKPIVVGGFGPEGLDIYRDEPTPEEYYGIGAVRVFKPKIPPIKVKTE